MTDTSGSQDSWLNDLLSNFKGAVNNIKDTAGAVSKLVTGNGGAIAGAMGQTDQAYAQEGQAIKAGSQAQQDVAGIQGEAAIKQKNDDSLAAQSLGVDQAGIATRAASLMNLQKEITGYDETLKQAAGTTLLNDPLGWIKNQFTVPVVESQREAATTEFAHQTEFLKVSQAAATQEFAMDASLDTAASAKLVAAQKQAIAAKGLQEAAQANEKAGAFNVSALEAITNTNVAGFDVAYKGLAAQETAFSAAREVAQANYYAAGTPERDQIVALKNEQLAEKAVQDQQLKAASIATNGAIPDNVAAFKSNPRLEPVYGEVMASLRTGGSLGFDPVDSLTKAKQIGMQPATGGEAATRNFIDKSIGQVLNTFQQPGKGENFKQLTPQQQHQYLQDGVMANISQAYKDVSQPGTPLSTLPYSAALKLPGVASTQIGQALTPLVSTAGTVNGTDLIATAKDLIKKGALTPGTAALELEQISKTMQVATNVASNLQKYAIPSLGSDALPAYNMSIKDARGVQVQDFTNRAKIENYLTRSINNDAHGDLPGGSPFVHY